MRPVIVDVARKLTRPLQIGGYELPAGSFVFPAVAALHYREDLFPDPHEFRPERFLEGKPDNYAWIPFGGGVRRCIGASFAEYECGDHPARLPRAGRAERPRPAAGTGEDPQHHRRAGEGLPGHPEPPAALTSPSAASHCS